MCVYEALIKLIFISSGQNSNICYILTAITITEWNVNRLSIVCYFEYKSIILCFWFFIICIYYFYYFVQLFLSNFYSNIYQILHICKPWLLWLDMKTCNTIAIHLLLKNDKVYIIHKKKTILLFLFKTFIMKISCS